MAVEERGAPAGPARREAAAGGSGRSRGGARGGGRARHGGRGARAAAGSLLAAALAWAPLPYGSNRPWSWSLLAAGVGLVLLLAGAARVAGVGRRGAPGWSWPAALLHGGGVGVGVGRRRCRRRSCRAGRRGRRRTRSGGRPGRTGCRWRRSRAWVRRPGGRADAPPGLRRGVLGGAAAAQGARAGAVAAGRVRGVATAYAVYGIVNHLAGGRRCCGRTTRRPTPAG